MKALSVIEISKLYGMTRQSIYKQVNKGNLTKNSDGKIDLSEAIRVLGEPSHHVSRLQTTNTSKLSEVNALEQQVYMLQKQLELAQEREAFQREELQAKNKQIDMKDEQITSLQRLLGAPKPQQQAEQLNELTQESQKRRGLFGRVVRAVIN